jgi:hypothetical protein
VSAAVADDISLVELDLAQEKALADASAKAKHLGAALMSSAGAGNAEPAFSAPISDPVTQPFGPTEVAIEPPMLYQGFCILTFNRHRHRCSAADTGRSRCARCRCRGVRKWSTASSSGTATS